MDYTLFYHFFFGLNILVSTLFFLALLMYFWGSTLILNDSLDPYGLVLERNYKFNEE